MLFDFDMFDVKNVEMLSASSPCESVTNFIEREIVAENHRVERVLSGKRIGIGWEKVSVDFKILHELDKFLLG